MVAPVRTRTEFDALARAAHRGRSGPIWVRRALDDDASGRSTPVDPEPRVAYAIGRSVGSAVVRNRVRRRLRAVMRELETDGRLGPGLHLFGVRPDVVGLSFDELRTHVIGALAASGSTGGGAR